MNEVHNTAPTFSAVDYKFSFAGVGLKTTLGLFLSVAIAIYSVSIFGIVFSGITGFISMLVLFFASNILMKKLVRGSNMSLLLFMILCAINGLFLGNIIVTFAYIFVTQFSLSGEDIFNAMTLAGLVSAGSVIGSVLIVLKMPIEQLNSGVLNQLGKVLTSIVISIIAIGLISTVFGFFGVGNFQLVNNLFYGISPIGIIVSIVFLIHAQFVLFRTILQIKQLKEINSSSHLEYAASAMLVYAIVNVYIEALRLILRLLALSKND